MKDPYDTDENGEEYDENPTPTPEWDEELEEFKPPKRK